VLRRWTPLWDRLRGSYRRALAALGEQHGVPVKVGGHSIRLAPDVVNASWESIEKVSYRAFAKEIARGAVVFDVGAHFGTYSIIAARRGGSAARVVAYEPSELTRSYLTRHLAWNRVERQVIVRPVCCGRTGGETQFFCRPDVPDGSNGILPGDGLVETTVPVTTMDDETRRLHLTPDVIKIDVEGAELDVLEGAERTLATGRPRLFISVHPKQLAFRGLKPDAVLQWLRGHGYHCDLVDEDQELHLFARPA
jgi:FkbM family methyltransferase